MEEIRMTENQNRYMKSFSNVGIIVHDEIRTVFLIDSGSNESLAKKLSVYLKKEFCGYTFKVLQTHCHVDHIKGGHIFQKQLDAEIYAAREEMPFGIYPDLEKFYLYSAVAPDFFRNSFFSAKGVAMKDIGEVAIPFSYIKTPGHSPGHMIFINGNTAFTGDLVFERRIAEKYGYLYVTDISSHLNSLEKARTIGCTYFVPAHGEAMCRDEYLEALEYNEAFIKKQCREFLDCILKNKTLDRITGFFANLINFNGDAPGYFLLRSYVSAMIKYHLESGCISWSITGEGMSFSAV